MITLLKKISWKHKNIKAFFYTKNYARQLLPSALFQSKLEKKLSEVIVCDAEYLKSRVNYYNNLDEITYLPESASDLKHFRLSRKNKTYFFDSYEYTRYFNPNLRICFEFGDVIHVPDQPSLVKSRPIYGNHKNSVILKLDKSRHFTYVNDNREFKTKKNMLVGRNHASQEHRLNFLEMYVNHPMCNIGKINRSGGHPDLLKEMMTIDEQLDYKFILCLEGNDVASNLKWVMSSGSLAVMPRPCYETWFMEGTLIPDYHYVLIKDDYSDLEERLNYFIAHTDKAIEIIKNANRYVDQFKNRKREDLISLLVLEKYFYKTGQLDLNENLKYLIATDHR